MHIKFAVDKTGIYSVTIIIVTWWSVWLLKLTQYSIGLVYRRDNIELTKPVNAMLKKKTSKYCSTSCIVPVYVDIFLFKLIQDCNVRSRREDQNPKKRISKPSY